MASFLFLVGMLNFFVLGTRGLLIAAKLKKQINYSASSLSLYYSIQSQVFSNSTNLVSNSNPNSVFLFKQCKQNVRLMYGIAFVCIVASIPFA